MATDSASEGTASWVSNTINSYIPGYTAIRYIPILVISVGAINIHIRDKHAGIPFEHQVTTCCIISPGRYLEDVLIVDKDKGSEQNLYPYHAYRR